MTLNRSLRLLRKQNKHHSIIKQPPHQRNQKHKLVLGTSFVVHLLCELLRSHLLASLFPFALLRLATSVSRLGPLSIVVLVDYPTGLARSRLIDSPQQIKCQVNYTQPPISLQATVLPETIESSHSPHSAQPPNQHTCKYTSDTDNTLNKYRPVFITLAHFLHFHPATVLEY